MIVLTPILVRALYLFVKPLRSVVSLSSHAILIMLSHNRSTAFTDINNKYYE